MPYVRRKAGAQLGSFTDLLHSAEGLVSTIANDAKKVSNIATSVQANIPNVNAIAANPQAAAGGAVVAARYMPYVEGLAIVAGGALLVHVLTGRHNGRRRR